ncbi:MAG: hypothetical protein ACLS3M_00035 [Collinsella sp.]
MIMELCLSGLAGKNVEPLCELLDKFEIPNYSIVDRDSEPREASGNHITTTERDFEAEVIETIFVNRNQSSFITLLEATDRQGQLPSRAIAKH